MLCGVLAAASVAALWLLRRSARAAQSIAVAAALAFSILVLNIVSYVDDAPASRPRMEAGAPLALAARPGAGIALDDGGVSSRRAQAPPDVSRSPAPSVSTLLQRLEARLAAAPDDAKGWALLAQSYAFVGRDREAEEALARAVTLGADEVDLRERVRLAAASTRSYSWAERAIGG
jgi:cytochrome c-type biogenesis protein CcmH